MSGLVANMPQPQASYNASKGAVIQLTKSATLEWRLHCRLTARPDGEA